MKANLTEKHFPHLIGYPYTEKLLSTRSPHPPSFGWSPFPTGEGKLSVDFIEFYNRLNVDFPYYSTKM